MPEPEEKSLDRMPEPAKPALATDCGQTTGAFELAAGMPESGIPEPALEQESVAALASAADAETEEFLPIALEDVPAAIEALLFASGDPLTLEQMARILVIERQRLRQILDDMASRYQRDRNRGILLREADGSFTLGTKPVQKDVLARLFSPRHRPPLSPAAYETLAIIAYNQPVTRAQIEAVRGVNSDNVLQRLIDRSLVREAGTLDAPGRPTLFVTSDQFLLDFGLRSVSELPPMEMLMYGTLRDIEHALENSANAKSDKQLTIDQIVAAIVPAAESSAAREALTSEPLDPSASAEVLGMSFALFGVPPEEPDAVPDADPPEEPDVVPDANLREETDRSSPYGQHGSFDASDMVDSPDIVEL